MGQRDLQDIWSYLEEAWQKKWRRAQARMLGKSRQGLEAVEDPQGRYPQPAQRLSDYGNQREDRIHEIRDDQAQARDARRFPGRDGLPGRNQRMSRGRQRQRAQSRHIQEVRLKFLVLNS